MTNFLEWFDVAKLSVLTSAVVGVGAILIQARQASSSRQHERTLAQDSRNQGRRETLYVDILHFVRESMADIEGTYPVMSSSGVYDGIPEDTRTNVDISMLNARVAAFGSRAVKDQLSKWSEGTSLFWGKAHDIARLEENGTVAVDERFMLENAYRSNLRSLMTVLDALIGAELQQVSVDELLPAPRDRSV